MLVLSRKPDQSIRIGENIEVRIVQVQGNRVKLGITAPDDCRILRGELPQWIDVSYDHPDTTETCASSSG